MEVLRKTMKNVGHYSHTVGWDLNLGPQAYAAGVLAT
jgi:hypothetical protein